MDKGGAGLFAFSSVAEADAHLRNWLETSCGLECYCGPQEEQRLCEEHGGELPELSFACPKVETPSDLEAYNGYHAFGFGGAISLFVMPVYDEESARRFRIEVTRAFELDKIFSEEADEMIAMLETLEQSFRESLDWSLALEQVNTLLCNEGLLLF